MIETILSWDRALFLKINTEWTNPWLDFIMPSWREAKYWVPLYLFIIGFSFYKFGWKIWPWLLTIGVMMTLSDQISSHLIKPLVARPRPCNDEIIGLQVRKLLGYCRNSYSFPSSHAVNHFCIAAYLISTWKPLFGKKMNWFWLWAASIAFGQVYVGVHFPIDVTIGSILGTTIGTLFAYLYNKRIGMPPLRALKAV